MAVDYHTQNGLNAYKAYIALKQHFTTNYDYFLYNGSTNASIDSYRKRKDAIYFEMLGKHPDVVNFIAFNFATFPKVFPKELATASKYKLNYTELKKKIDSLQYHVKSQLRALDIETKEDLVKLMSPQNGMHPPFVRHYLANEIDVITLCLIEHTYGIIELYDKKFSDPIWQKISNKIKKIKPFINMSGKSISQIILT